MKLCVEVQKNDCMFHVKWAVIPCEVTAHFIQNAKAFLLVVRGHPLDNSEEEG